MYRSLWWSVLALAGACGDSLNCPEGTKQIGSQCREVAMPLRPAGDGTGQATADGGAAGKSDGATPGEISAPSDSGTDPGTGSGNDAAALCEAEEVCDGEDNDCDGKVDQSFACVLGSTNFACKTSCGTNGKGACSSSCQLPGVAECVPPAESCNAVDDNCDGAVDEGLYARKPGLDALFSQQVPSATFAQVGLAARPLNGMWAFARAEGSQDGELDIVVMSLEPNGWTFKSEASLATDGATYFAVDGDKQVVALASRVLSGGNRSLRLQLFEADQLTLLSTRVVLGLTDPDDDIAPVDVSIISDGDKRHVAILYWTYDDDRTPKYQTALRVSTYQPNVGWTASADVVIGSEPWLAMAVIERLPCRDEWLLATTDGSTLSLKRVSAAGTVIETSFAEARTVRIAAFGRGEDQCAAEEAELALLFSDGVAQRFSVRHEDGAVRPVGASAATGMQPRGASLVQQQGKWFFAGSNYRDNADGVQVVRELTFFDDAVSVRSMPLAAGGGLEPGGLGNGPPAQANQSLVRSRSAIAALDNGIVVALPSSFSVRSNLQARLSGASPGTPLTAIAAVYQMGCP